MKKIMITIVICMILVVVISCDVKKKNVNPLLDITYDIGKCNLDSKINKNTISVYTDEVIIKGDFDYAVMSDTGSMLPVMDGTSMALLKEVNEYDDVKICDILVWVQTNPNYGEYGNQIAHRVIYKGFDEQGYYFITKGDNEDINDRIKVREDMIRYIVVGILY